MKDWMCAALCILSLLMGCYAPRPDWSDKDVDFLLAKLESWHFRSRSRAIWYLDDTTEQRDRVIAALTDIVLTDTHEEVRSYAARALRYMTPPAVEALPALREALSLPEDDRGKPMSGFESDLGRLPTEVESALGSIIASQKALEAIKESGPPLIESSIADGDSNVDAEFINEHGITLRLPSSTRGYCAIRGPDQRSIWERSFARMVDNPVVTLKPLHLDDPKLVNGTVYVLEIYGYPEVTRFQRGTTPYLINSITFTTKE